MLALLLRLRLPTGRKLLLLLDALAISWALLWIFVGVTVGELVNELTRLSDTIGTLGRAVDESGRALGLLDLPLIGGAIDATADSIREAGRGVVDRGESTEDTIQTIAVLLGLTIALAPTLPLLLLYLPPRLSRELELRSLRQALREGAGDPTLERFLAERAAQNLPYRELRRISLHPWRDLEEGRYRELAKAELKRAGLPATALADSPERTRLLGRRGSGGGAEPGGRDPGEGGPER